MPHRMLRNRTLCQASRVAFGFSGVRHEEETDIINVEAAIVQMPATPPPKAVAVPPASGKTPQAELESVVITAGFTFNDLAKWGLESGNIEGADSMGGFNDVTSDVCKRLLKNTAGLLKGMEPMKGQS